MNQTPSLFSEETKNGSWFLHLYQLPQSDCREVLQRQVTAASGRAPPTAPQLSEPGSHDRKFGGFAPQHPFLGELHSTLHMGVGPDERPDEKQGPQEQGQCVVLEEPG